MLVGVDDRLASTRLHGDRHDLILKLPRFLRGFRLLLRRQRKFILLAARNLPLCRHVLGRGTHVVAVERIPQAVLDHGVDKRQWAHLLAVSQMRAMGRQTHALLTAGYHDIRISA